MSKAISMNRRMRRAGKAKERADGISRRTCKCGKVILLDERTKSLSHEGPDCEWLAAIKRKAGGTTYVAMKPATRTQKVVLWTTYGLMVTVIALSGALAFYLFGGRR